MASMHPGTRIGPTEMSGTNSSDINSRANETFGETYARLQREAWASGSNLDGLELMMAVLLTLLTVRLVGWFAHRRVECT
jgi:hypothetical protein